MLGLKDVEPAKPGATCREVLVGSKEKGHCGLKAGTMFMGCPLCRTHLNAVLQRAYPSLTGKRGYAP